MPWRRAWQPTPVLLPKESQDRGAWRATIHGVAKSQTRLKQLSRHHWGWGWGLAPGGIPWATPAAVAGITSVQATHTPHTHTHGRDQGWLWMQGRVPGRGGSSLALNLSLPRLCPASPRKKSLLVNNVFVLAAAALFGFSRRAGSFEMIMLGRLLVGISAGTEWAWGSPFLPLLLIPFTH